jgi:hypothetical protein
MAERWVDRTRTRGAELFGGRSSATRHPLVAAAMVLPIAALLAVLFGGWEQVVTQASSVAGVMGR